MKEIRKWKGWGPGMYSISQEGRADETSPAVGPSNISETTPEVLHGAPEERNKWRNHMLDA
jgi:hypothetical protein